MVSTQGRKVTAGNHRTPPTIRVIRVTISGESKDSEPVRCAYHYPDGTPDKTRLRCNKDATPNSQLCAEHRCQAVLPSGQQCTSARAGIGIGRYCSEHSTGPAVSADLETLKLADEHYRQDMREYWTRTNIFVVVEAALLAGFGSLVSQSATSQATLKAQAVVPNVQLQKLILLGILAVVGVVFSIIWLLVNNASYRYVERWRRKVHALDQDVDNYGVLLKGESRAKTPAKPDSPEYHRLGESPSKLARILPVVFAVAWIALPLVIVLIPT